MNLWMAQASLGNVFQDFKDEAPWLIGGLLVFYVVLIFALRLRKGNARASDALMPTLDFERMRRTGLLSDEEYKKVKRKMVGQAAERLGQTAQPKPVAGASAAEKLAMLGAAIETEGLESVLSPEELAEAEKARRLREAAERAGGSQFDKYRDQPAEPRFLEGPGADGPGADPFAAGAQSNQEADAASEAFGALDPLARASAEAASEEQRLKGMLKAGVISREEYEEMKAFYEKKQRGG